MHRSVLQRKCACSQHTIGGGECAEWRSRVRSWSSHRGVALLFPALDQAWSSSRIDSAVRCPYLCPATASAVQNQYPILSSPCFLMGFFCFSFLLSNSLI